MPKIEIGITDSDYIGTFKNQKRITFSAGSEKLSIRLSKNANSKTLQTSALKNPFEKFELQENKELVKKLIMKPSNPILAQDTEGKVLYPLKTDLGLINNWPQKTGDEVTTKFLNGNFSPEFWFLILQITKFKISFSQESHILLKKPDTKEL